MILTSLLFDGVYTFEYLFRVMKYIIAEEVAPPKRSMMQSRISGERPSVIDWAMNSSPIAVARQTDIAIRNGLLIPESNAER